MVHKVFTVYDAKAEAYLPPFFLQARGQAVRAFADCVNKPSHEFYNHPEDYTLFELGSFCDSSGEFIADCAAKIPLGVGLEYKENSHVPTAESSVESIASRGSR